MSTISSHSEPRAIILLNGEGCQKKSFRLQPGDINKHFDPGGAPEQTFFYFWPCGYKFVINITRSGLYKEKKIKILRYRITPHYGACTSIRNHPIFQGEKSALYIGAPDRFRIVLHETP